MFQRALCVYPYRRELNSAGFFPPIGLESIANAMAPFAQALDIIDLRKEKGNTVDFLRPDTDIVCFSVNWDRDAEFLQQEIRSVPPSIFTIVGGRHATQDPQRWLLECPNVDIVVRGDGEEAVEEICRGAKLESVTGISFRRGDQIINNPNRVPAPARDDLFPNRRLRKYSYDVILEGANTGIAVDLVSSSRGCPFNCGFCSFSRNPWGTKRPWSARSPESVVAELEQTHAKIIGFTDDLFTYDMDRVEKICDLILAKGIRKKYIINARLEIAKHPAILRKMERAGFIMLLLGIESTQDRTLKSMRKGFTTALIREYFKLLRDSTMILHGYFILGNIGESLDDMRQILPFARDLGLDTIALSTLRAAPYSGLDELVADSPGYHIAPNGKIFSDQCSVQDLRQLRRKMTGDFYTLGQVYKIVRKGYKLGAMSFLPGILPRIPSITWHAVAHLRKRAKRQALKRLAAPVPQPPDTSAPTVGPLLIPATPPPGEPSKLVDI